MSWDLKKDKTGVCRTEKGRSSQTERPMFKEVRKARSELDAVSVQCK